MSAEASPKLVAPAGGWITVMTGNGQLYHVLDPADDVKSMPADRRSLCGQSPVFPVRLANTELLDLPKLCRNCRKALTLYEEAPPPAHGPDPLLHLLRAGGLSAHHAQVAAGICRGYLASEMNSALARGEVVLNERATRRTFAGRETAPLRFGALMLAWGRDVVHARRLWPPDIVGDPPGEPDAL